MKPITFLLLLGSVLIVISLAFDRGSGYFKLPSSSGASFSEIGFVLEMNSLMDCVKILENVEKGQLAKIEFRKGAELKTDKIEPIALLSMRAGNVAAGMIVGEQYYVFPSELCRASLALELPNK